MCLEIAKLRVLLQGLLAFFSEGRLWIFQSFVRASCCRAFMVSYSYDLRSKLVSHSHTF